MLWAVIMAGGSGTRFWPESRIKNPKQFLPIFGRPGQEGAALKAEKPTLFEQTLVRIRPLIPKSRVIVVTQKSYAQRTAKLGRIPQSQIIGEPVGRNTAPCVILAAAMILKKDPHAVLAILPSDHQIGKPKEFCKILDIAAEAAKKYGDPVTFGMHPSSPHTGYGYLEMDSRVETRKGVEIYRLRQFHEKPSQEKAGKFLRAGNFLWNGGIFIWSAAALWKAAQKYLPEAAILAEKIANSPQKLPALYPKMPEISIDYGLMEKMKGKILTIPANVEWCDLGGWKAFQDLLPADAKGNILKGGKVLAVDSHGNFVKAGKRLIALLGVKDLVVVDSEDALLICSKDQTESIRKIVADLKNKKMTQYL